METTNLQEIFDQLKKLLEKYNKSPLVGRESLINTQAKEKKPTYVLYGKKEVAIGNRKPQQTYFVGIILQKNFVGFYSMPIYSHAKKLKINHPELKKFLKGKSCFNVTHLDKDILKEIDAHLKQSLALYKQEGWV